MLRTSLIIASLCFSSLSSAWSPQGEKIKTRWAETVTPETAWQIYPRPQLKRSEWKNLNGLWDYQVTDMNRKKKEVGYGDQILVPFSIESSLSGVAKKFNPTDKLWYRKEFTLDPAWKGKQILLHFGAVDYACQVWVNNRPVGTHTGGNNPFSFDITRYLKKSGMQTVELCVTDPTDTESITRGKQQLNQRGIWYTPVSGIWQTVWLEPVSPAHIRSVLPETDIRNSTVKLHLDIARPAGNESLQVKVLDEGKTIQTTEWKANEEIELTVPSPTLWSPRTPKLYGLEISLSKNGKELDKVTSYFAMRKVSIDRDEAGYKRICLNGNPVFQYGTLDQGWWPDGLLTPPSPEAMIWDMVQLKEMGFNTIRKHIKVEPATYYYYADSLGIMLWQDMPSGFATARREAEHLSHTAPKDWDAPAEVAAQWSNELNEMIDHLRFFPSITSWVVFNEGWGQHNTVDIVESVMRKDTTRIINGVSGWTDRKVGHVHDIHNYPSASMVLPEFTNDRVSVLGEFGGLGLPVQGSLWNPEMNNWGYKNIDGSIELLADYSRLMYDLETLIAQGLSAAIYTQTTDVEGEVNGLITYDRKQIKIPAPTLHMLHSRLYIPRSVRPVFLMPHSQKEKKTMHDVSVNGETIRTEFPLKIRNKGVIRAKETFKVDKTANAGKPFEHLSLWLNADGPTTVSLNGVTVLDQNTRHTRNYNQYNLSNFKDLLREGENTLEIVIEKQNGERMLFFDYGLTAF